ncbi:MAG: cysteine--tRNA ligase, partial [Actinomycetales bacterium]|nr:cysteine--tRNA ligase [Actinomycetales bacterium]
ERISGFVARASKALSDDGGPVADHPLPAAFSAAMDDDLNLAEALVVVHETLRAGNTALAEGDSRSLRAALLDLRAMLDVLGLDPTTWATEVDDRYADALDGLVQAELTARADARAAKDFATADAIRDRLAAAGIVVEDGATGARWSLEA